VSFEWVDSEKALDDVIDSVLTGSRYAIDTEFHRERTYYPKLALVQVRWGTQTALIDPLAVDPRRLGRLFTSEILAVFHAAQQDLEVLRHASLEAPRNIFDCQVAAGFVGYSTPSLATLVQALKKTTLSKGDRHDDLTKQLNELGRVDWVKDACSELASRPTGPQDPSDAWLRLKEVRALKGPARGVAQSLARWREERAMRGDLPPRRVMSDMALLGISQRVPKSVEELANTRGVDDRHLSAEYCREIMTAVRDGAKNSVSLPTNENDEVDKFARPALTLITAWVGELARKHKIDATLLATRSDITAFLRQSPKARLREGWRATLIGDDLMRILNGEVGLSVDRDGHLKLISSTIA
jgi:ribonuclease D